MNAKKLLKLADILKKDAKRKKGIKFDMSDWGFTTAIKKKDVLTCHTRACAMGLAAISRQFRGLDFKIKMEGFDPKDSDPEDQVIFGIRMLWKGKKIKPLTAAQKVFDLNYDQAAYLFATRTYLEGGEGELKMVDVIRDFVECGGDLNKLR